jgi:hypothetical protein
VKSRRSRLAALACAAVSAAACGKMGPPQPPLRPVPVPVSNLTIERAADEITLKFTVPSANRDGSQPPRIDGVEVYAVTQPASAPAPAEAELAVPSYRIAKIAVRRAEQPPATPPVTRPGPGDPAIYVDKPAAPAAGAAPMARYYAVAGMAGKRRGPVSKILAVPLGAFGQAPSEIRFTPSEKELKLTWSAGEATDRFLVEEVDASGAKARRLSAEPLAAPEYSLPIEFGKERCFVVRVAQATTDVTVIGPASAPACVRPVDTFAPSAPASLEAFTTEGGVDLLWRASASADVAGYIVLRAEGADGTLQPLTAAPITATQYRDQSVKAGVTYVYQVVAIDGATPPNRSEPSNKQVVTARPSGRE